MYNSYQYGCVIEIAHSTDNVVYEQLYNIQNFMTAISVLNRKPKTANSRMVSLFAMNLQVI